MLRITYYLMATLFVSVSAHAAHTQLSGDSTWPAWLKAWGLRKHSADTNTKVTLSGDNSTSVAQNGSSSTNTTLQAPATTVPTGDGDGLAQGISTRPVPTEPPKEDFSQESERLLAEVEAPRMRRAAAMQATYPSAGSRGVAATGDPHLQNVYGERFDLMRPGKHTLLRIPREQLAEHELLRVEADAVLLGVQCTDMYFQELNLTGVWAEAKRTGGLHFHAQDVDDGAPTWDHFGKVEVKVAHGRTQEGARYLNFYVKHLAHAGVTVGGLLGEDDHTEATMPLEDCVRRNSMAL